MAGRHSRRSSKVPAIIVLVLIALIVVLSIVIVVKHLGKNSDNNQITENTAIQTTVAEATTVSQTDTVPQTTEQGVTIPESSEVDKVVVPTQSGAVAKYFNATYVPYRAEDVEGINDESEIEYDFVEEDDENTEVSLKEVFGSAYSGGVITFNDDGTFTDTLLYSSLNKGSYVVEGDRIVATYVNDKNIYIDIDGWDGDTPSELIINYGGYDVFFSL